MTLYVLEPVDRCADRSDGLECGSPRDRHPITVSGFSHKFKPGRKEFRLATSEEIEAASKKSENQIKAAALREFDTDAMAKAWGGDRSWWTTGSSVASLIRAWLDETADELESS